ncbi:pyruvate decarboxylase isozyme 1 [Monosporozyma unispora]|nr:Pyruvate decarboxylase 1 [Kazachstania unispora]
MDTITLGQYLFERLNQVDCTSIFGLPGDFNLVLLDSIYRVAGMRWIGDSNELNAAYAASGYARVKGMACLLTTFGVGELSALNGIAGDYAEHVGVLHVVGMPSTTSQAKHLLLHHTLGNGDFDVFHRMSAEISDSTAVVSDIETACQQIDDCIRNTYIKQRPVYLGIPSNFFELNVPVERLHSPINLALVPNNAEDEEEAIENILALVKTAKNPIIISDACAVRHDCKEETKRLIDITQFPAFTTPMGKGSIDEHHPRYGGVYVGTLSEPAVKQAVESADLILSVGALLSDFNTGTFSYNYNTKNVIEFHSDYIKVKSASYPGVQMKPLLQRLLPLVGAAAANYEPRQVPTRLVLQGADATDPKTLLRQNWLWGNLGNFLQEGDIILTETGTSAFGINSTTFPNNTTGISQVLWGSIGFTGGAVLGASLAAEELDPNRRVILFIGDGSLQLTVQEISTMIKWNLHPYLFVLNNNGYTIEKLIHGENADYNQIQPWNHLSLLPTFGATDYDAVRVATIGDWNNLTQDKKFQKNSKIRLIEVMLPVMDAPDSLVKQGQLTAQINSHQG